MKYFCVIHTPVENYLLPTDIFAHTEKSAIPMIASVSGGVPNCPESDGFAPIFHNIGGKLSHTLRGNGVKSGQGWNAGIYAIWEDIMRKGKAGSSFFDAADKKFESI